MCRAFLHALLLLCLLVPVARAGTITLLLSQSGGPYVEFTSAFLKGLEGTAWTVNTSIAGESAPAARADLIVTAGASALRQALLQGGNTPLLATLLPRQAYERNVSELARGRARLSAIYLDQSPARQAAFLRQILPEHKRVGMLLSAETRPLYNTYRQIFGNLRYPLSSEDFDNDALIVSSLANLLPRVDVLLAIPDSTVYKRDNIKPILVTSYRYQRPLVGFSAALVNAGALAAIYSTPTQIGTQSAELIRSSGSNLPAAQGPDNFAISINRNVADALNLSLPDEAQIRRALLADKEAR